MGGVPRAGAMFLLTLAWSAAFAAAPLAAFRIDEESIAKMRKQHPLATVEVDDPIYKRKQRYQGFWLRDVLSDLGYGGHPEVRTYLRFRCKDGYLAMIPLARAMGAKGVDRDPRQPRSARTNLAAIAGARSLRVSLARLPRLAFASRWPRRIPWPYQLVAVELVSSSEALAGLDPDGPKPGLELFVAHCLKCHAMNGVGGTLGPELNSPCSVTEYWNPRLLSRFIANGGSIRTGTRMPRFDSLLEKELQGILAYLQSMAGHKTTGAACP